MTRSYSGFDPLAVCFAIRLLVEKTAYGLLDSADKSEFVSTACTKNKLDFAASRLTDIPETFFLLGLIYNTNLHWKQGRDYVTPLINKLQHPSIRAMAASIEAGGYQ